MVLVRDWQRTCIRLTAVHTWCVVYPRHLALLDRSLQASIAVAHTTNLPVQIWNQKYTTALSVKSYLEERNCGHVNSAAVEPPAEQRSLEPQRTDKILVAPDGSERRAAEAVPVHVYSRGESQSHHFQGQDHTRTSLHCV